MNQLMMHRKYVFWKVYIVIYCKLYNFFLKQWCIYFLYIIDLSDCSIDKNIQIYLKKGTNLQKIYILYQICLNKV